MNSKLVCECDSEVGMAVRKVDGVLSIDDMTELMEITDGTVERIDKPQGGEVYVFCSEHKQDWRADGYRYVTLMVMSKCFLCD